MLELIGAVGHGLAAVAYATLALVLLAGWRGRPVGFWLIVAVVLTAVWAAVAGAALRMRGISPSWVILCEQLRLASWLVALAQLAVSGGISRRLIVAAYVAAAVGAAFGLELVFDLVRIPERFLSPKFPLFLGLGMPLVGLLMLEQLYRNLEGAGRRAFMPLFLGLGAMFVYDVFMYSEGLMVLAVSAEAWAVRGFAVLAAAPGVALAARRNPAWSLDVFISRQIAFYSTTLVAVGIYLVAMSLGGYLIARFGGQWGEVAQLVFLGGGIVVLLILVFSDDVRARMRVFLSKHFYRNKYDYRAEWLRFVRSLSTGAASASMAPVMIRAVAQILGSPAGLLWVRVAKEGRFELAGDWSDGSVHSPRLGGFDADPGFIEYLERRQWIVDFEELARDPALYENLHLPAAIGTGQGIHLLVPLMHGGRLVGLLGLGAPAGPFEMTYEDRDLMKTVGQHLGTHIAQIEADKELAESRQFEAYSRLTAFMMHDLKNLVAQLALVVANAEKHRRNPEFVDDAIETIRNSTERMGRLIEQLQRPELQSAARRVALAPVLDKVVERVRAHEPRPGFEDEGQEAVVMADPERLAMVIEHVVRNAQDATAPGGTVRIRLARNDDRVLVQVSDTGTGMSEDFVRTRLFRPFDSTKGPKGMGIGAYQVRDYVRALGGDVNVASAPGAGTTFSILLPLAPSVES